MRTFASAPAYGVRNCAVKADRAQNQSQCREASHQVRRGAVQVGRRRIVDHLAHGRSVFDSHILVEFMDRSRKERQDRALILRRPDDKIEFRCWVLVERNVFRGQLLLVERAVLEIIDDPDDLLQR